MSIKKLSLILLIISLIIQSLVFTITRIIVIQQNQIYRYERFIDSINSSTNKIKNNILISNLYVNYLSSNSNDSVNNEVFKNNIYKSNSEIESQIKQVGIFLSTYAVNSKTKTNNLKQDFVELSSALNSQKAYNNLLNIKYIQLAPTSIEDLIQRITNFQHIAENKVRGTINSIIADSNHDTERVGKLTFFQFIILIVYLTVIYRSIYKSFKYLMNSAKQIIDGNLDFVPPKKFSNNEIGAYIKLFSKMVSHLRENRETTEIRKWIRIGENNLYEIVTNKNSVSNYSDSVLSQLCHYISASCGAFYTYNPTEKDLHLSASYAMLNDNVRIKVKLEETILGEASLKKDLTIINDIPEGYIKIESSLGNTAPKNVLILPIYYDEQLIASLEIAKYNQVSDIEKEYLTIAQKIIANTFLSIWNNEIREKWNI
jgi:hypothetical protein